MGEIIWTRRDSILCRKKGICKDPIYENGGWIQYSSFLGCIKGPCWEKTEVVARWGMVDSDIKDRNRRQLSFGLNYHVTNTLILKSAYDISHGEPYKDTRFTIQLAHAY